jgi:hypothetical protein
MMLGSKISYHWYCIASRQRSMVAGHRDMSGALPFDNCPKRRGCQSNLYMRLDVDPHGPSFITFTYSLEKFRSYGWQAVQR